MKTVGSVLALIGGILVILLGLGALFSDNLQQVWQLEYTNTSGFVSLATILALAIIILAVIALNFQPRIIGIFILLASFAGVIFGGTFVDICMILTIVGSFILITLPSGMANEQDGGSRIYQKWWFWVLLGLLCVAIIWGLFQVLSPVLKGSASADSLAVSDTLDQMVNTQGQQFVLDTTPEEILKAYNENGYAADARFKGNPVRITGKIFNVMSTADSGSRIVLKAMDEYHEAFEKESVICNFSGLEATRVLEYKVGDTVSLIGIVQSTGGKQDDIVFENCSIDMP